jgi:hypothetical protein
VYISCFSSKPRSEWSSLEPGAAQRCQAAASLIQKLPGQIQQILFFPLFFDCERGRDRKESQPCLILTGLSRGSFGQMAFKASAQAPPPHLLSLGAGPLAPSSWDGNCNFTQPPCTLKPPQPQGTPESPSFSPRAGDAAPTPGLWKLLPPGSQPFLMQD